MQAEIIVIGTELLLGQIIDTNAAYIAQQLSSLAALWTRCSAPWIAVIWC